MCVFNIKQSEMARLTKRSRMVQKKYKKKPYTKKTKKSYKSSSKGYKKMSLTAKPKRMGSTHWLSYGNPGYFKGVNSATLKKDLTGQGFKAYNVNSVLQLVCTAGVQGYGTICAIYDNNDINQANGGRTKHFLKSALVKISMSNQANASVFLDLYDIQCRNDVAVSNDPVDTNFVDATQAAYYGTSLFQFQNFTETYKINRVTSLNLAAGETAEHRVQIKPGHLFKDDEIGSLAYKGLTRYVVYVIRGPASDDTATEATVGSLKTKVDVIVSKEYRIQAVTNTTNTFARGSNLSTAADKVMELDGDETTIITA